MTLLQQIRSESKVFLSLALIIGLMNFLLITMTSSKVPEAIPVQTPTLITTGNGFKMYSVIHNGRAFTVVKSTDGNPVGITRN